MKIPNLASLYQSGTVWVRIDSQVGSYCLSGIARSALEARAADRTRWKVLLFILVTSGQKFALGEALLSQNRLQGKARRSARVPSGLRRDVSGWRSVSG